jgi:uncharacterized cupin superfamily protein/uncharacterized membrane protein YgcG
MRPRSACLTLLFLAGSWVPGTALAGDYSNARIVRLSLAQGDVRFSRPTGDAGWEAAVANLPIREGYVVATGDGRAAVEFEHGDAAYLADNSTLEFTQLGLSDGAFITHLRLSQGTATFYAHPGDADEFVVAAPTLTVSLGDKGSFRLDVTGDGAWVSVLSGQVRVQYENGSQEIQVENGRMLALHAGESVPSLEQVPPEDDFDKWVAGREETLTTETTAALQYANSPVYTAGFADLAVYGAWLPYSSFGYCWRPFGVGLGWAPFMSGMWTFDPFFGGWNWISYEPWGWLPYHFGGWVYSPVYGWLWVPGGSGLGGPWRPITGTWVHGPHGPIGVVPIHPLDRPGSVPLNAANGFLIVPGGGGAKGGRVRLARLQPGDEVQVLGQPPSRFLREGLAPASAPSLVPRDGAKMVSEPVPYNAARPSADASAGRPSSIVYDPHEKRFVNANAAPRAARNASESAPDGTALAGGPVNLGAGRTPSNAAVKANPEQPAAKALPSRPVYVKQGATPSDTAPQESSLPAVHSAPRTGEVRSPEGRGRSAGSSSQGNGSSASSGHSSGGGSVSHGGSGSVHGSGGGHGH